MKTLVKLSIAFVVLLCLVSQAQAQGFSPFDACTPNSDLNPPVSYKQLRYSNFRKTTGPDDYFYETRINRTYAALNSGVKLVEDYWYSKFGTNAANFDTVSDGPIITGNFLDGVLGYSCGSYANGAFVSWEGGLLNVYLNGGNIQEGLGNNASVSIEESRSASGFSATFTFTYRDDNGNVVMTDIMHESMSLDGAFVPSKDVNDGKDDGENCDCSKSSKGVPIWYVTEPYINLWIRDTPVFYSTSLGAEIAFEVMYKQRDTRPTDTNVTSVPVTGWQHNWFSYISVQTPDMLIGVTTNEGTVIGTSPRGAKLLSNWIIENDSSQWQSILYSTDGGENYFDYSSTTESDTELKLTPTSGGFRLVHPDGSQDIYAKMTVARPVFGPGSERGLRKVKGFGKVSDLDSAASYSEDWSTNSYSEFNNQTPSAPIGSILGYRVREALLTERIDPYGNSIRLYYDTNNILTEIVDYDNKTNTLTYTDGKLTQVDMLYGKQAVFTYNQGFLTSIRDAAGMTSYVTYSNHSGLYSIAHGEQFRTNYYVASLITPYGTTAFEHTEAPGFAYVTNPPTMELVPGTLTNSGGASFSMKDNGMRLVYVGQMGGSGRVNRSCKITNPDGSHELYVYQYDSTNGVASSYPAGIVPASAAISGFDDGLWQDGNGYTPKDARLTTRNSFYWNRQQSALIETIVLTNLTASQIYKARMKHWLAGTEDEGEVTDSLAMERQPSPNGTAEGAKTWFDYAGKSVRWRAGSGGSQHVVARVMPDGNVAYQKTSFNGGLLSSIAEPYTEPDGDIGTRYFGFGYEDVTVSDVWGTYDYKRLKEMSWPGGSLTRYFSADGKRMDQVDSLDNTNTVFFNNRHQVSGIRAANGATVTNLFGADGFLSKRIAPQAGATNTYQFINGLPATNTTPLGLTLGYDWDNLDRLTHVYFSDGTTIQNIYTKLDLTARKDRAGNWSLASYNSMRQLESSTDAKNQTTQYSWCLCGALESITDPLNLTTTFTRDNNGNVKTVTASDGFTTTYVRDIFGRVTQVLSSAGLNVGYAYNIQGLVNQVVSPAGTVFSATFDENDLPLWLTDASGVSVTNTFDVLGRLLTRKNALGNVETYSYNSKGLNEYKDALERITSYGYDPAGRLASITNANLEVTKFGYNSVGELASLTDARNNTKRWAYDMFGRQMAETNAAGVLVKTNGYNANGWLTAQWTAAKGKTTIAYDPNGNLTNIIQPNSGTIAYTYDALDRLLTFGGSVGNSTLNYANWGAFRGALTSEDGPWSSDTVNYGYSNHKLTSIGLGSWSQTIGYDAALRPETFTDSAAGTFTYSFNGAGQQVASLTMPHNLVTYGYDDIGALTLKQLKRGGTVLDTHGYVYDPAGLITNITRLHGVTANYGYDPIGQLVKAEAFESGGAPRLNEQLGYGYDKSHNLAYRTNNTLLQSFTSNSRNELANAVRVGTLTVSGSVTGAVATLGVNGTLAEIYSDQTFATTDGLELHDGNNMFVAAGSNSAGTLVLSTKVTTKLPAMVSFTYDLNGNLLSDGMKGFEYDDANQLVRVTVVDAWKSEFSYDGLGRRRITKEYSWTGSAWTQTNEIRYVWDAMVVLQERDDADAVQVTYTRGLDLSGSMQGAGGIGGLLARTDSSSTTFYHSDAGGNITSMTDAGGNVVARYLYDPFGNLLAKSGLMADVNKYRFSSKEVHPNSGIYYYGYRFYEPNLQRWLNEDPIGEAGGINLFGFVGNSPINSVDALGLVEFNWFGIFDNDYPEYIKKNNAEWAAYLKRKGPYDAGMKAINWNDPKSLGQSMDLFNKYRPDLGKPSQPYMLSEPGVGQFLALDGALGICKLKPKPTVTETAAPAAQAEKALAGAAKKAETCPVKPGDTGAYGELKARKKAFGETEPLDMDHRPSFAAQVKAAERAKGRSLRADELANLKAQTPAVATPRTAHQQMSRTYGGRNTDAQSTQDSFGLEAAKALDDAAY